MFMIYKLTKLTQYDHYQNNSYQSDCIVIVHLNIKHSILVSFEPNHTKLIPVLKCTSASNLYEAPSREKVLKEEILNTS